MPRSGTGTYNGVIIGQGVSDLSGGSFTQTLYDLGGTGRLTANFGDASFASTLSITGRSRTDSSQRNFGDFVLNGTITGNVFNQPTNGRSLVGTFYGPEAAELAALFNIIDFATPIPGTNERIELNGLFLGKKAP